MSSHALNAEKMKAALRELDSLLSEPVTLIVGGGGALILAHWLTLVTTDIDAIPKGMDLSRLDAHIKEVARRLDLSPDWLNAYYATFTHTLPPDYGSRLISVLKGKHLEALALGKDEMLILKCFAHRLKDVSHAQALIKKGANPDAAEKHIESLLKEGVAGSREALDFLDDLLDQE